jgi:hypothetical protein
MSIYIGNNLMRLYLIQGDSQMVPHCQYMGADTLRGNNLALATIVQQCKVGAYPACTATQFKAKHLSAWTGVIWYHRGGCFVTRICRHRLFLLCLASFSPSLGRLFLPISSSLDTSPLFPQSHSNNFHLESKSNTI